jgi:hypothetical protein
MPDDAALQLGRLRTAAATAADTGEEAYARSMGDGGFAGQLRELASTLRAWSMFTDGLLPATKEDRIAVGARRADALLGRVDETLALALRDTPEGSALATATEKIRLQADVLLETAGDRLSGGIAERLRESLDAIDGDVARYRELAKAYRSSEWVPDYFAWGQLQGDAQAARSLLATQAELAFGATT